MSLRRSARITSSTASAPATTQDGSDAGVTENGKKSARKTKASQATNAKASKVKPDKSPASASSPAPGSRKRKSTTAEGRRTPEPQDQPAEEPESDASLPSSPPQTPKSTKRQCTTAPFTPAGIAHLTRPSASNSHILDSISSRQHDVEDRKPRPADPHTTNAPLATPRGKRALVAYSSSPVRAPSVRTTDAGGQDTQETGKLDNGLEAIPEDEASPRKKTKRKAVVVPPDVGARLVHPSSTVETLLEDACEHLRRVDETGRLKGLIEKHYCKMFSPEGLSEVVDPFTALASGIIGQQVSGAAAASIRSKFTALFPETHPSFPSPAQVIAKDLATLRTAGLSQRKAEYIHGLAEKFAAGELSAEMLISASDEELIEKLVAVRGLGRWSVEMFACFGLKRMDVFSTGDLGVQRGMATYVGRDVSKLKSKGGKWKYMPEKEMLDIAAKFSPYRSLFMWYMWRIEDVDVSVLQNA